MRPGTDWQHRASVQLMHTLIQWQHQGLHRTEIKPGTYWSNGDIRQVIKGLGANQEKTGNIGQVINWLGANHAQTGNIGQVISGLGANHAQTGNIGQVINGLGANHAQTGNIGQVINGLGANQALTGIMTKLGELLNDWVQSRKTAVLAVG